MINYSEARISKLIVHQLLGDDRTIRCSTDECSTEHEQLNFLLLNYIFENFKEPQYYRFQKDHFDEELGSVHQLASATFENSESFKQNTVDIMNLLAKASSHPQINSGDLIFAQVDDVIIDDELLSVFCIIKSENKDDFLMVHEHDENFSLKILQGIGLNRLEKACLVFNTQSDDGYKILLKDNVQFDTAKYWTEFLNVLPALNDYNQTTEYLMATQSFVKMKLKSDEDFDKIQEIDVMQKASNYMKGESSFDTKEFANSSFPSEEIADDFQTYISDIKNQRHLDLSDQFSISDQAVEKNKKIFKSVIKLDKNFHIYVHGNRNLIEKGVDENGKRFYKVFYETEQ